MKAINNSKSNAKTKILIKILRIVGDVLTFAVMAFALFALVVSITSKKDSDGTATVFGYQLRFVQSDSMAACALTDVSGYDIKSIPVKSCIFVQVAPEDDGQKEDWYKQLKVGDVLTFKYVYTKQETITHRIVDIREKSSGGYLITLEGDNKNSDSNLLQQTIDTSLTDSPDYIIGKVTGQSYFLGLVVYAFKSPVGIICLIIIPCLIIIGFEVIRIVNVLGKDRKEKAKEKEQRQTDEIEELKRQLALLQKQNTLAENPTDTPTENPSENTDAENPVGEERS